MASSSSHTHNPQLLGIYIKITLGYKSQFFLGGGGGGGGCVFAVHKLYLVGVSRGYSLVVVPGL